MEVLKGMTARVFDGSMTKHSKVLTTSLHDAQVAVLVETTTVEAVAGSQPQSGDKEGKRMPVRPPTARRLFHNGAALSSLPP